jgi:catechol 2,3-dioxygenase-like lactoylglutathione lyase family enzyme
MLLVEVTCLFDNALASVAVRDLASAEAWYVRLLGRAGSKPMADVVEWTFPSGGGLQVYALAERAGHGSLTLVVRELDREIEKLDAMGVDTSQRTSSPQVKTVMVTDPDGNHIALAEALGPSLVK